MLPHSEVIPARFEVTFTQFPGEGDKRGGLANGFTIDGTVPLAVFPTNWLFPYVCVAPVIAVVLETIWDADSVVLPELRTPASLSAILQDLTSMNEPPSPSTRHTTLFVKSKSSYVTCPPV